MATSKKALDSALFYNITESVKCGGRNSVKNEGRIK